MKLTFNKSQCFTVPEKLYQLLNDELAEFSLPEVATDGIILSFRDPDYLNTQSGYHSVEVRIEKSEVAGEVNYQFVYLTDLSFQGLPYPELTVDIDVCFIAGQVYTVYGGWLDKASGEELKELFLTNFISYVEMKVFEVEITFY